MDCKSYSQICPVARALDVVGDRWTLLLLRELLGGPARFHQIEEGLPGVAKNLLTRRLRQLEDDGIVRRVKSHGATLYALTEVGAAIRPVVEILGFWGTRVERVAPPKHDRSLRAIAMALQAILVRAGAALPDEPYTIELEADDESLEIVLGPQPTVTARTSTDPDARVRVPTKVLSKYLSGKLDKTSFEYVSGDKAARTALLRAMAAMA